MVQRSAIVFELKHILGILCPYECCYVKYKCTILRSELTDTSANTKSLVPSTDYFRFNMIGD